MPLTPLLRSATDMCSCPGHYRTMKLIKPDKLSITPHPFLISITPQRDPWEPVMLSTPCSSARLFHSKHPAANVTRRINYAAGRVTRRGGVPTHHTLWQRSKTSGSAAPRSPERERARSLPSGRLCSLWCVVLCSRAKEKKNSQRVQEVAGATSALLEAVVQKVAIHDCVSGSLAPALECWGRRRQLVKCLGRVLSSVIWRQFCFHFVVAVIF